MKEENIFDTMGESQGVVDVVATQSAAVSPTSPEWSDYVMSHFHEAELFDGRPTVVGLRRVAELLIGRIKVSMPVREYIFAGSSRSAVSWTVQFEDGSVFGDIADCSVENTDDMFLPFALATAATRAEARSLRKALRIRGVAAEEITSKNTAELTRDKLTKPASSTGEFEGGSRATDRQVNFLEVKCRQLNIDLTKFLDNEFKAKKERLTKDTASKAIDRLNAYQNEHDQVPKDYLVS